MGQYAYTVHIKTLIANQASIVGGTFMQRLGRAIDIAHSVAFLCSDYSTFISGQVLSVNGGGR